MIANQDTLLKSAYMNEWYWVVAMNISFNLPIYLRMHKLGSNYSDQNLVFSGAC